MFDLNRLLRPHLQGLVPYSSARDEYTGHEGVFLDANENALGSATTDLFNRYPDPYQRQVKQQLGAIKGIDPAHIIMGNGSDEVIDLLFRAFCRPGIDSVLTMPPTYGMYQVSADINNVAVKAVPLTANYHINTPAVLEALTPEVKLVFVCCPNNPTGNTLNHNDIMAIVNGFDGLVVIDEAYIDFSAHASFVQQVPQHPNLVVMQTFSKAWGMAALRLGMGYASAEIVQVLNKIKPPYNINGLTQQMALEALAQVSKKTDMVRQIVALRHDMAQQLAALPMVTSVHPSDTNFLLVQVGDAQGLYDYLVEQRIIVRNRSRVTLCDGCLRITVGTPEENQILLNSLTAFTPVSSPDL